MLIFLGVICGALSQLRTRIRKERLDIEPDERALREWTRLVKQYGQCDVST
jgi:hypothetical protein